MVRIYRVTRRKKQRAYHAYCRITDDCEPSPFTQKELKELIRTMFRDVSGLKVTGVSIKRIDDTV